MNKLILSVLAMLALSSAAHADAALTNGSVVRITSTSIEGGWHSGHLHRDKENCWMVKLDKPTKDHYTMLSLLVVERLEMSNGGGWNPVSVKPVLEASPAACREYGAD
jgi:hypothetical protein